MSTKNLHCCGSLVLFTHTLTDIRFFSDAFSKSIANYAILFLWKLILCKIVTHSGGRCLGDIGNYPLSPKIPSNKQQNNFNKI